MNTKLTAILISALLLSCANKTETPAATRLAVTNSSGATTTVTVTTADSSKSEVFTAIGNGLTSSTREISFSSLAGVQVSCAGGCTTGTVTLTAEKDNTITVYSVASTTAPTVVAVSVSSGGGW